MDTNYRLTYALNIDKKYYLYQISNFYIVSLWCFGLIPLVFPTLAVVSIILIIIEIFFIIIVFRNFPAIMTIFIYIMFYIMYTGRDDGERAY